jgi:hypothetical protein
MFELEIDNLLSGTRLCNDLSKLLVNKFDEISPDCDTEITVFNHKDFFVVNGFTTCKKTINVSEIFRNYIELNNNNISKEVRVIDVIRFVNSIPKSPLNTIFNYEKQKINFKNELTEIVDLYYSKKIQINLKVNLINKIFYYEINENFENEVLIFLENKFNDYKFVKFDFSNVKYQSEKQYGLSYGPEKLFLTLGEYISNHIFHKGISKKLIFSLSSNKNYDEINNENIIFNIENNDHIVNKPWLESLILDIFPFNLTDLKIKFEKNNLEVESKKLSSLHELLLI